MSEDREKKIRQALYGLVRRAGGEATLFSTEMETTDGETLVATQNDDGSLTITIVPDYVKHSLNTPQEPIRFGGDKTEWTLSWDPAMMPPASGQTYMPNASLGGSVGGGSLVPNSLITDIGQTFLKTAIQPYQKAVADKLIAAGIVHAIEPKEKKKAKKKDRA